MLLALRLQNFKAWRDTGRLELAPLTLLFGPNSSGKSSLNHLLMMLKQTVRSPDRNSVFDLGDENSPVDLGSFRDLIFHHDLKRRLEFEKLEEMRAYGCTDRFIGLYEEAKRSGADMLLVFA